MNNLSLREGLVINGAKLLRLIGRGKSGEVWSALTEKGDVIALKVYLQAPDSYGRAEYEYTMASKFSHSNILKPLSLSTYQDCPLIRLPYCEGRSVDGIAAHFCERTIWKLIADISSALSDIHAAGLGHFDVKPSNILWDGSQFILTDFGSCCSISGSTHSDIATDESSFRFDSPELKTNRGTASDIWSLGATVFFLYMGCHVFNGLGGKAQHADSPVPFMRKSLPVLSQLVQNCLALSPQDRPTAKVVYTTATAELSRLENNTVSRKRKQATADVANWQKNDFWPETMIETLN